MLEVIKKQRDANNFIALLRVISVMNIFQHAVAPLKVVDHILRKFVRIHHLASLVSNFSKQFQLPNHRFKQHQNAPFSVLAFNIFSAVQLFQLLKICFLEASDYIIYCPCFQHFINIFFQKKTSFKMRKDAPFSVLSFKTFTAVPTLVYRFIGLQVSALGNEQTY